MCKLKGTAIKNAIAIKLGRMEITYGLTYVVLSRVTKFNHITLIDKISMNRLHKVIDCHPKIEGRINEKKRLQMFRESTLKYFS